MFLKSRRWRGILYGTLAMFFFVGAGYVSNALSLRECERRASEHVTRAWGRDPVSVGPATWVVPWIVSVPYVHSGGFFEIQGSKIYFSFFGVALPSDNR